MPTITIDNQTIEVEPGTSILEAAARLGIEIPTLCYRHGVNPQTACMVCVVRIEGRQKLVPSCATLVEDAMVVESETEPVIRARRAALELILSDHVGDCVGPCQTTCPAHMDIPGMIRLINEGRMDEAVALVKQRIPFPAVLGRICPQLCESGCRRGQLDAPVSIKLLKRYVGDYDIARTRRHAPTCAQSSGKSVGIVGAGPAGLSAAYYLRIAGHNCVIYDEREMPGGMLRYGVPEADLPRDILDAEIQPLAALGVEFRASVRVGAELTLDELRNHHDACIVAIGDISVQGECLPGLPVDGKGLAADRHTHQSPLEDVFVAGSALSPTTHAVRSVAGGRSVAQAVDLYLRGEQPRGTQRPYTVRIGRLEPEELERFAADTPRYGRVSPEVGKPGGFSDAEARTETARCLHCECAELHTCRLRQIGMAYEADPARYRGQRRAFARNQTHPLLVYEPGKCIACGLCIQIARDAGEELGLSFTGRGYGVKVSVPVDRPISEGLQRAALECVEACPTAALTLRQGFPRSAALEPPRRSRPRRTPLRRPFPRKRRRYGGG